ncbi:hypothetical protein RclHR1_01900024 [Rhizophagus clarus]|uniref:3CxxC-type domain-containing protein n=1 Tax=Rhizophagus clarus TaxID=94130 RepID=A0A2Z6R0V5_9GLOM|nr:hypothetical protein RclHR1_01900024 [Rhizophagus clarus]GES94089.1 hypothetical protein GLOIN_2v1500193 [Rhizophagus clarus]
MTDETTESASSNTTEEVTEPIVHDKLISRRIWYYVFGEWSCPDCENEWTHKRTRINLSKYKNRVKADDLQDNERVKQQCRKCSSKNSKLIKYSPLSSEDIKPPVRDHLIWKDAERNEWYRVYGTWDCDNNNCETIRWTSAYTFVLLSKYLEEISAADLTRDTHYWGQDCKSTQCNSSRGTLKEYRPLRRGSSKNRPRHLGTFCHKCPVSPCVQTEL